MTPSVTPLDFFKTLPLRRENLTHPLTLLFGAAIASLTVGLILYRRWSVQPTDFDLAQKAYSEKKYQDVLRHCDKALRLKVGTPSEIHLLESKAYIGLNKYGDAIGACAGALEGSKPQKRSSAFLADVNLQWAKALVGLGNWTQARVFYHFSWTNISDLVPPLSSPRLKFEILIGKVQVLRKTAQLSDIQELLDRARANLHILNPSEEVQEEYRELFVQFYYTRIYYFLDTESYMPALIDCESALKHLGKPSNDQELDLKAEILVLQSLLLAKQGKTKEAEAFSSAMKVLQLDPVKGVKDRKAHLSIVIDNKEILAATYFLCALCASDDSSTASHYYEEALKNAEIDEFLKAAILFKRGDFYLKQGKASSDDEKALGLFKTALEDFEAAQTLAIGKVVPKSDLLKHLLRILELTNLEQKIRESLNDKNITAAKSLRQLQQRSA